MQDISGHQHLNDRWDLDHPYERLLVDTAVAPSAEAVPWINPRLRPGEVRRVLTGIPGKTGVVYTLDRETGEFLWAAPTATQNVIGGIDGATGAVTENAEVVFNGFGEAVLACPTLVGDRDWEAGAYSPLTNTMYYPLRNACARMMATDDGSLYALSVRTKIAPAPIRSARSTRSRPSQARRCGCTSSGRPRRRSWRPAGGLLFGGDTNGRFRAHDHETGDVLWEIKLDADGRVWLGQPHVHTGATGTVPAARSAPSSAVSCTDGRTPSPGQNVTHPRVLGAFTRKLRQFVLDEGSLPCRSPSAA